MNARTQHRLAALGLLTLVVGACSAAPGAAGVAGSPTSLVEPTDTVATASLSAAPATAAPAITLEPTDAVMASPDASPASGRETISPDALPHADPALEAALPTRIGAVELVRGSSPATDLDSGGDICFVTCPAEARLMADGVGAELEDMTVAFAIDPGFERFWITAWKADAITGQELADARLGLIDSDPPFPIVEVFVVGDDMLTMAVRSGFPNDTYFWVARDDVLIVIWHPMPELQSLEPALPDEVRTIVEALP